jgi:MFS transporter, DHA3 family, multidrug efflux protein
MQAVTHTTLHEAKAATESSMATFHGVLVNTLTASLTNTFVWFAVTFWVYLQTQSVLAMSLMAGIYLGTVAVSGFFLGSLVDRYPKKWVMIGSSLASLALFGLAGLVYATTPAERFTDHASVALWAFVAACLVGAIAGNVRGIALSTLVTVLVPEERRDKANGLVGSANGVAFLVASVLSGLVIGALGVAWMLGLAIVVTLLVIGHLATIAIPDQGTAERAGGRPTMTDFRGTLRAIRAVPGLLWLIFFTTLNNLLGGVFMALMDAYGLLLVSVEVWGVLWGVLSLGFIVGGLVVARRGLGAEPLRTLFGANIVMWTICAGFALQSSIALLAVGMFIFLCLIPAVEAAEQTIVQKVIPPERQGRVFGFAQSVEQAASPLTALMIGPIAQYVFIPFMTTGAGVDLIGGWFGTGQDRGLGLLFTVTGAIGVIVTLLAMRSRAYRRLAASYREG